MLYIYHFDAENYNDIVSNCVNQSGNKAELNNIRQIIRVVVVVLSPKFKRHVAGG